MVIWPLHTPISALHRLSESSHALQPLQAGSPPFTAKLL